MKPFFVSIIIAAFASTAYAVPAEFTGPSFYHCDTTPKSIDELDQCAQDNLVAAQGKKAPLPKYKPDMAHYFYEGLNDLQKRHVLLTAKPKKLGPDDALFQRHLGEWLYFTQGSYVDDGKLPEDYNGVDLGGFATAQAYAQPDGSFVIFYWDYNGAANSCFQAVRLTADSAKPLRSENYDEIKKKITVDAIANFNDFSFNPKTGHVVSTNFDAYNSAYNSYYALEGDLFRLAREKHSMLTDSGKTKITILYKAP